VPFTARQMGEVPAPADGAHERAYDVDMPYRRLGRCRMSEPVAAALTTYEARHGKAATESQLMGAGVDLGAQDGPA
jgi:hypothetical protein